jgi:hypothetical protein
MCFLIAAASGVFVGVDAFFAAASGVFVGVDAFFAAASGVFVGVVATFFEPHPITPSTSRIPSRRFMSGSNGMR